MEIVSSYADLGKSGLNLPGIRQAAREFGLSRKSIRKMLQFSLPPGYVRIMRILRPKLGPWLGIIDLILVDDKAQHKKQRHADQADL